MNINTDAILALPIADKLQLMELLWNDLSAQEQPLEVPDWVEAEAVRRRDEMRADANLGLGHEAVWDKIAERND